MNTLPEHIQNTIFEFKDGDDKYWRNKFKNGVLKELECFPKEVPWCLFLWGGYANQHGCCDLCDSWSSRHNVEYTDRNIKFDGYAGDGLSPGAYTHLTLPTEWYIDISGLHR